MLDFLLGFFAFSFAFVLGCAGAALVLFRKSQGGLVSKTAEMLEEEMAFRALLIDVVTGRSRPSVHVWFYEPTLKKFIAIDREREDPALRLFCVAQTLGGSVHAVRYDEDLQEFVRETITADTPLREIVA